MKMCPKCKTEKELNDFYVSKRNKDGLTRWCKECNKAYQKGRKPKSEVKSEETKNEAETEILQK